MSIKIKTTGTGDLQQLAVKVKGALGKALSTIVLLLKDEMQKESPVDEGIMRSSMRIVKFSDLSYGIEIGVDYWRPAHFGAKAHTIVPVNASVLRFEVGGKTVFARFVKHPGNAPNPFIERAIDNVEPKMESVVESVLNEVLG